MKRVKSTPNFLSNLQNLLQHKVMLVVASLVLVATGFFLATIFINFTKGATAEKVLTVADLANPDVELSDSTSSASVDNLKLELNTKINAQIANQENPIETVKELVGVLSNTTNNERYAQLASFVEGFLENNEQTLAFKYNDDIPSQAQINYWKSELYAYLIHNYQLIMENQYLDKEGRHADTSDNQLKYIDRYLTLANDPASHPPIPEEDKDIFVGYIYSEVADFSELKNNLTQKKAAQ